MYLVRVMLKEMEVFTALHVLTTIITIATSGTGYLVAHEGHLLSHVCHMHLKTQ